MTSLAEVFREALRAHALETHTCLPARVVSYDRVTRQADVKIVLRRAIPAADGDGLVLEDFPELKNIPVIQPGGSGVYQSFDLWEDDFVVLIFSDLPVDRYRAKGAPTDPGDHRLHHLGSALALPMGDFGRLQDIDPGVAEAMTVGRSDGNKYVIAHYGDGNLYLGVDNHEDPAMERVALEDLVKAELSKIKTAISNAVPTPMDGGAGLKTSILAALSSFPGDVGAERVYSKGPTE